MSKFELYLLTRLDAIQEAFEVASFILLMGLALIVFLFPLIVDVLNDTYEDASEKLPSLIKKTVIALAFCGLISAFIPTTKDLAIIYGLNYITNNKEAQKLPDNVLKTINKQLEEWQESKE